MSQDDLTPSVVDKTEVVEEPVKLFGKKRGRPPGRPAIERDPPPIDVGDDKLLERLREVHPGRDLEEGK